MAKTLKFAYSVTSKLVSGSSTKLLAQPQSGKAVKQCFAGVNCGLLSSSSRAHNSTLSRLGRQVSRSDKDKPCEILACTNTYRVSYSTEVEKDLSTFLEKEIKFESSKASDKLPKIAGFDITTDGGDVTLTKSGKGEKITIKLSVNGAVDSFGSEDVPQDDQEPPQMVCRPPFNVEISKGSTILALQCSFPSAYPEDEAEYAKGKPVEEQIGDQFEIEEIAIHGGEWTDTTYTVSAETMDAELFDLLMDMLDERGINDEFVAQLIDFCTAYENQQYVSFLQNLKSFVDK
ncbi:unnamed protein product [Candidula unifasciata]|uniref:Complement component 1 Q subcomponent-binding protein, mitochondrial n=1 Tax=Candidula unifasciata TaxID=100452 RepID=A0A8S3ZTR5_9EUPU|nr:unnamed protein product [Candidula unifasciata]